MLFWIKEEIFYSVNWALFFVGDSNLNSSKNFNWDRDSTSKSVLLHYIKRSILQRFFNEERI